MQPFAGWISAALSYWHLTMTSPGPHLPRRLLQAACWCFPFFPAPRWLSDAETPEPHWSGLPIWGAEAEAKGYQIPHPFGIGVTAYSARQPVNIQDLQLGRAMGLRYRSRTSCRSIRWTRPSRTSRRNSTSWSSRFWTSTRLRGYTTGTTRGLIQVPGEPILGIFEPRELQLNASFTGPTYGAGATLQGGGQVSDWRDLTAFGVADWNRTQTMLSFENESLIADTKPLANVFSARVGLHGTIGPSMGGGVWVGAMHQSIQQTVAGSVANTNLQFVVVQSPTKPWNTLLGGLLEFGKESAMFSSRGASARAGRSWRQLFTASDHAFQWSKDALNSSGGAQASRSCKSVYRPRNRLIHDQVGSWLPPTV